MDDINSGHVAEMGGPPPPPLRLVFGREFILAYLAVHVSISMD
jgi:hypothetical protein